MCEIMTIITAVIFTVILLAQKKKGISDKSVVLATLMFWGAALMWSIDGVFSVIGGEPFFNISLEDTLLGVLIICCGLGIFAIDKLVKIRAKRA